MQIRSRHAQNFNAKYILWNQMHPLRVLIFMVIRCKVHILSLTPKELTAICRIPVTAGSSIRIRNLRRSL